MVNMSTKFDEETHHGLVSMFTMSKFDARSDAQTDGNTLALPLSNALHENNKGLLDQNACTIPKPFVLLCC